MAHDLRRFKILLMVGTIKAKYLRYDAQYDCGNTA